MAKSGSCFESLRSFLTRRRITTRKNRMEKRGGDNDKNLGCDRVNDMGRDDIRRIEGESDGERTHCCASDDGDECTRSGAHDIGNNSTVHYFNHASQAPLSPDAQKLGIELLQASPWEHTDNDLNPTYNQARVRTLFALLIDDVDIDKNDNEDAKDLTDADTGSRIAMFPSTAFAITLAARNVIEHRKKREDCAGAGRILVLQDQFDSAIYPWQQMCNESKGQITLDIVGYPDDDLDESSFSPSMSGWTRAILEKLDSNHDGREIVAACLPPLHWSDGTLIDLEAIGAVCRDRNIPLIVDATQAVGIMPCSVKKIRPTMLACSTHKWLRGPSGCCLAYISPEVQDDWIPLDYHGRGRDFEAGPTSWDVSRNEMGPCGYPEKYYGDARKFDSGGKANPLLLPMLRKAMEEVALLNPAEAQLELKTLMNPLLEWVVGNGYSVKTGPRAYHIIGLVPDEKTPEEMIEMAKKMVEEKGVILAVRCGGFRVSSYLTNTPADVFQLIEGLKDLS